MSRHLLIHLIESLKCLKRKGIQRFMRVRKMPFDGQDINSYCQGSSHHAPSSLGTDLMQIVQKLLDGSLLSMPNVVTKTLNIRDNIAREHEQILPGIGQAV